MEDAASVSLWVRGDQAMALRDVGKEKYWAGEIELDMREIAWVKEILEEAGVDDGG